VELVWSQDFPTRYEALAAERQIKGWSRKKKLALVRGDWDRISRLAKSKNGPLRLAGKASRSGQASTSSGRTGVGVSPSVLEAILAHAVQTAPEEACGLLLGEDGRVLEARPAVNVAADKNRHFEIDPQALIDAHRAERGGGPQLIGYYHSHPSGPPEPSATDRASAARDGKIWSIAAGGEVRFWRDGPAGFEELSYTLIEA
jgi:proteasome lid subunit RPN8/RPN11